MKLGLKNIWKKRCTLEEARFLLLACFGRIPHFDAELETYTGASFFGSLKRVIDSAHFRRTVIDPATLEMRPLTLAFQPDERQLIARVLRAQFDEVGQIPETWLRLMRLLLKNARFQRAFLAQYDDESLRYLNKFYAQRKSDDVLDLRAEVHQISPCMISIHIASETELPRTLSLFINGVHADTVEVPARELSADIDHRFEVPNTLKQLEEGTLSLFVEPSKQLLCSSIGVALSVTKPHHLMQRISEKLDASPDALSEIRDSIPSLQQYASLRLEDYGTYADFYRPGKPATSGPLPGILLIAQGDNAADLKKSLSPSMSHCCTVITETAFRAKPLNISEYDFVVPAPNGARFDGYFVHWLAWSRRQYGNLPLVRFGYDHVGQDGGRCDPVFPCRFDPFRAQADDAQSKGYAVNADRLAVWMNQEPGLDIFSADIFALAQKDSNGTGSRDYIPHILMTCAGALETQSTGLDLPSFGTPVDSPPTTIGVIIPTRNRLDLIKPCVESLWATVNQKENMDIIIVDNGSETPDLLDWFSSLREENGITILKDDQAFNWSALNNRGAAQSSSDILLFLNDDTAAISHGWDDMVRTLLSRTEVGTVGAKLLYPDDTIQHGGILFTDEFHVVHEGKTRPASAAGYTGRLQTTRVCDAVTGAFLACRRNAFEKVEGFDENFAVTFNDIDFCARLDSLGLYPVYSPEIQLYHYESKSRGIDEQNPEKLTRKLQEHKLFVQKWGQYYQNQWNARGRTYPEIFDMETAQDFMQLRPPR